MSEPSAPLEFVTVCRTDVGRSRQQNQDYGFVGALPGAEDWTVLVVADGLGGHAHGEWASERATAAFLEELATRLQSSGVREALERAVAAANRTVFNEGRDRKWNGSATTLAAVLYRGGEGWWVNVGDSRIYGRFGGEFEQLSFDHSVVAEQVRAGLLPASAAALHPHRNVVTRTVGFEPWVEPDQGGPLRFAGGDLVLLCSDGLHGVVEDEVIAQILRDFPPEEAAGVLVDLANGAGGPDNITVAIGMLR